MKDVGFDVRCPHCKSQARIEAEAIVPLLASGLISTLLVCLDCGGVYVAMPPWKRDYLKQQMAKKA